MISDYETNDLAVRVVGDVVIVRFKGENLSSPHEVDRARAEVTGLVNKGALKLVVDFKYVKFAGSQLLGMLLGLRQQMIPLHGRMIISHAERINQLLVASRTSKLFELAPDPKEAAKLFEA